MTIPPWQFQRAYTPELMKRLLQITAVVTLVSVSLDSWLGLQQYLTLSPQFYTDFYIWQPITSLFLLPSPVFSLGFLIDFAFSMLVFWLFGSIVMERLGKTKFLTVYLASGILSGFASLAIMEKFHLFAHTSGFMPIVLAITTLWAMMDPYQEILLFFVLPLKAKWVLVVALFGTLFVSFIQQEIIGFTAYFTAFIFSYFWGLLVLGLRSPFDWMTGFDRLLKKVSLGLRRFWQWRVMGPIRGAKNAMHAHEDAFVDATLDKISKDGSSSLSAYERIRLKWVSFKKRLSRKK